MWSTLIICIISQQLLENIFTVQQEQYSNKQIIFHNTNTIISSKHNTPIASNWMDSKGTSCHKKTNTIVIHSNKMMNKITRAKNGNGRHSKTVKVLHWNAGSCHWENKTTQIESFLLEHSPDICIISEANIWDTLCEADRLIPGYNLHLPSTMQTLGHARIALLVREGLVVQQINHKSPDAAVIWCKIGDTKKNSIIIGGAYRQHHLLGVNYSDSTWQDVQTEQEIRWRKTMQAWRKLTHNRKSVLLGDLNLDYLKWENPDNKQVNMVEDMKEILENTGHKQIITTFTRSARGVNDSLLDHIWTTCQDRISRVFNMNTGASDHRIIGCEISLKEIKISGQNILKRTWKNYDQTEFLEILRKYNWNEILLMTDVNLANSQLEDWMTEALDKVAPLKIFQTRSNFNNWIQDDTKTLMKSRDAALIKARNTKNDSDWLDFRNLRNQCTNKQRTDRSNHQKDLFLKLISEKDSKLFYKTSKKLLGFKNTAPPTSFRLDGVLTSKQKDLANAQARHYSEKIKKIKNELPKVNQDPLKFLKKAFLRWKPPAGKPEFSFKSVTLCETMKMLSNLSNSHAFGRDKLDASILKTAAPVVAPAITHILNLSLGTNIFPPKWKLARVIPLLKGKDVDPHTPESYRPISLLPIISKLSERSAQVQILHFLETMHQLNPDHHAYRSRTSTTTALLQMMDLIATSTDANLINATLALDLSAAFDCVVHTTLHEKLKYYGFDQNCRDWLKSYLQDRSFYTVIGSAESDIYTSPHGVPQGSVLGPLLYLIYVNEMPAVVEDDFCVNLTHANTDKLFNSDCPDCGTCTMYADDGLYSVASNSRDANQDKIDTMMQKLKDYLNSNGLKVNESKTKLTEFMSRQKRVKTKGIPPEITIQEETTDKRGRKKTEDKLISDVGSCKMLGVKLQNSLSWDIHLNGKKSLLPRTRSLIGSMHRICQNMSREARQRLVSSFVINKMSYAICLWGNNNPSQIRKAQTVLNTAARLITRLPKSTRINELMTEAGWFSIENMTTYHSIMNLWKFKNWDTPTYFKDKITITTEDKFTTNRPRLILTSTAYRWNTVLKWNTLPTALRQEKSHGRFKNLLKTWIRDKTTMEDRPPDDT